VKLVHLVSFIIKKYVYITCIYFYITVAGMRIDILV
jgi:hypothetical protein